jgi:redox-sensitive bicupin YhaK (pirin superfamily)
MLHLDLKRMSLGDGFTAAGLRGELDPFISVDNFLMTQPTFPPHPHAGFNVLTYMLRRSAGSFVNRASFDIPVSIHPGDLHWTVAGSGMVHEEVPSKLGVGSDGLQIFINLQSSQKLISPASLHQTAEQTASLTTPGATIRIVLGSLNLLGQTASSQLKPPTSVTMLDIDLSLGTPLVVPIPAGHNAFALITEGSVRFNDDTRIFGVDTGALFGVSALERKLSIKADEPSQLFLFSGVPINETLVAQGPFVMNTADQIRAASDAYRQGRMGSLTPYYPVHHYVSSTP